MTTATQETLREKLVESRARVIEEIRLENEKRKTLSESSDQERYGNHPGDEGTDTFEKGKSLAIQGNLEAMLAEIDHALFKFDEGTYGKCENCGQTIPLARLEIRPQATLCVACKALAEHSTQASHTRVPEREF